MAHAFTSFYSLLTCQFIMRSSFITLPKTAHSHCSSILLPLICFVFIKGTVKWQKFNLDKFEDLTGFIKSNSIKKNWLFLKWFYQRAALPSFIPTKPHSWQLHQVWLQDASWLQSVQHGCQLGTRTVRKSASVQCLEAHIADVVPVSSDSFNIPQQILGQAHPSDR